MSAIDLQENFYFNIKMPTTRTLLTYSGLIGLVIILAGLVIGFDPFVLVFSAIIILILFAIYGFIVYLWWLLMSKISVRVFLENPLRRLKEKELKASLFLKFILGQDLERAFVQIKTQNKDISTFRGIFKEMSRIAISFYAFSFFFATILNNTLPILSGLGAISSIFYSLLFAMTLAPLFLGVYIPFALVVEDSRLMLLREDGSIDYLGTPMRSLLDGIFSISGLVAGFSLISKYTQSEFDIAIYLIIFGFFMGLYFIFLLPYFLPLMFFYYQQHVRLVNKIRKIALEVNVIPAWTKLDPLGEEETNMLKKGVIQRFEELPPITIKQDIFHSQKPSLVTRQQEQSFKSPQDSNPLQQAPQKPAVQPTSEQQIFRRPHGTNFCTFCGYKLQKDQFFCNKCGNRIKKIN